MDFFRLICENEYCCLTGYEHCVVCNVEYVMKVCCITNVSIQTKCKQVHMDYLLIWCVQYRKCVINLHTIPRIWDYEKWAQYNVHTSNECHKYKYNTKYTVKIQCTYLLWLGLIC